MKSGAEETKPHWRSCWRPTSSTTTLFQGSPPTAKATRQILAAFRSAFPDLNVTTEDIVADGDRVVSRWTARGTHQGELMGIAPTGNRVTIKGIDVLRTAEGRIVERWAQSNDLELMQQLGVVPEPGQERVEPSH